MSKYDKERAAMGIKTIGTSSFSANKNSKYAAEREAILSGKTLEPTRGTLDSSNDVDMLRRETLPQRKQMAANNATNPSTGAAGNVQPDYTVFGRNILPVTEKDSGLSRLGKGIVNYGAGTALRALDAPLQAGMQFVSNVGNFVQGKPLDFSEKSLRKDILPKQYGQAVDSLASKGAGGQLLSGVIQGAVEGGLDPATYIGGGIIDDLARAGRFGKSAALGTTENLLNIGTRQQALLNKIKSKVPLSAVEIDEVQKTPELINIPEVKQYLTDQEAVTKAVTVDTGNPMLNKVREQTGLNEPGEAMMRLMRNSQNKADNLQPVAKETLAQSPLPKAELPKQELPKPSKRVGVDPTIEPGMKERGVSENIRTDTARPDELRDSFSANPDVYKQVGNKETLNKANQIFKQGLEPAVTRLNELIDQMKPEAAPLAKMIGDELTKLGQIDRARELLSNAAAKATEAGQFGQAWRILRNSDPSTLLMTVDKQLKKLNEQGLKQYGKKWANVDLTPDEIKSIQGLKVGDDKGYDEIMESIGNRISQQLPSSALEKFDAWRRVAMLLNPKTHVRNVAGNVIMSAARKVADTFSTGIQKAVLKEGDRTASIGWRKSSELKTLVDNTWEDVKKELTGNARWDNEIGNLKALGKDKRIFKTQALNRLDQFSKKTLALEDNLFTERAYKDALGSFMNARKLKEVTDEAMAYAKRRAYEATFKQDNAFATFIQKQKNKGGLGGKLLDAALPFVKTPSNIVLNSIEYSPAGFVKAIFDAKNGKGAARAIEDISKGLTGTGIAGLGYFLASKGLVRSEKSASKNAEGLLKESGEQPYSFKVPFLDGTFTFDWAQPIAVPFAMGIEIFNSLAKNENINLDSVTDAIASGGDTIFNMSMLQTVRRLLGGSFGSPTEGIMSLPVSYLTQAVPTVLGQATRAIDDTQRSTYDTTGMGSLKRQVQSKIPVLSKGLEPKLDIWGEEQKQGGALQQFILPGYYASKTDDAVTKEVKRLYDSTGETSFLPKLMQGKFTNKGKQVQLTPKQLTEFQKQMGQENYKRISQLIKSDSYKSINSDDTKAKMIERIVSLSYENAKKKALQSGQK